MNKKLLALGLTSASLLLAQQAFAAYPTIQEPVAKTSGFYVSGQMGWGDQRLNGGHSTELLTDGSSTFGLPLRAKTNDETGLAGRIAAGYNINHYLGLELGAGKWSDAEYKATQTNSQPFGGSFNSKVDTSAYSIDLLAKVQYPFDNGFRVFAKGGIAYVNLQEDSKSIARGVIVGTPGIAVGTGVTVKGDDTVTAYRPELAAGVAYDFNEHWSADLAYSRIFGRGSNVFSNDYIPDLDMATVGITYNI